MHIPEDGGGKSDIAEGMSSKDVSSLKLDVTNTIDLGKEDTACRQRIGDLGVDGSSGLGVGPGPGHVGQIGRAGSCAVHLERTTPTEDPPPGRQLFRSGVVWNCTLLLTTFG